MGSSIPLNIPSVDAGAAVESSAPPWHLIHFDVRCARCGHDLRGQVEPVCPACKLEFSWADAAPLEKLTCGKCNYHLYGLGDSRCPECGTKVDWNEALLRHRSSEKPLFEYRWRDRPIRSLVKTWKLSLCPRAFWKAIDLHDPPRAGPLAVFVAVQLLATLLAIVIFKADFSWGLSRSLRRSTGFGRTQSILELPTIVGQQFSEPHTYLMLGFVALWFVLTLISLMVFRMSMRLCQVRFAHVLRVCTYSALSYLPILILAFVPIGHALDLLRNAGVIANRTLSNIIGVAFLSALILFPTIAIFNGYRHYIRMPHSPGVAICSQLMAGLAMAICITLFSLFF